ncbi:MAG TPA: hypothetical protein VJ742_08510 [Nitrososphaera sp.]|nr:hypothetical protein [Nitrososphaera sp.]
MCATNVETPSFASRRTERRRANEGEYRKPLDVEWICAWCHRKETPPALGERTPKAKLTASLVIEIRESKEPSKVLASKYGMEKTAIERVRSGRTWKHIKAAKE